MEEAIEETIEEEPQSDSEDYLNPLWKLKIVQNKKKYNRKKMKSLLKNPQLKKIIATKIVKNIDDNQYDETNQLKTLL